MWPSSKAGDETAHITVITRLKTVTPKIRKLEEKLRKTGQRATRKKNTELLNDLDCVGQQLRIDDTRLKRDFESMSRLAELYNTSYKSVLRGDCGSNGSTNAPGLR